MDNTWTVRRSETGNVYLIEHVNDVDTGPRISGVAVPNDFDKEDTHVEVICTTVSVNNSICDFFYYKVFQPKHNFFVYY